MENKEDIKENKQGVKRKCDEKERISREYNLEEAGEFIIDLIIENDYSVYVPKDKYHHCLKIKNIKQEKENDFLKYLIIKEYIRNYYNDTCIDFGEYMCDEELENYVSDLYNSKRRWYINLYKNDLSIGALKRISKLNKETEKLKEETMHLTEKVKDSMKDILSIMAFFVSLVALISINMEFLKDTTGFKILIVNLSLILSIGFIFLFITLIFRKNNFTDEKKRDDKTINIISIIIVILSIVLCGICILDWHYSTNSYTSKEENLTSNITNFNFN